MAQKVKETSRYYTRALRCPDGSRKYIRGKTKEELDRKVAQAQAELGLGISINDSTTVAQFAQMWVDVYKRPRLKEGSLAGVLVRLNNHILPFLGGKRMRDVKPADCALVLSRAAAEGMAAGSVKGIRASMKELFECAVENGVVVRNPVQRSVVASGRGAKERSPLSEDQLDTLCDALASRRDREDALLFVMLVRYTGMRASEALGLHASSVDLDRAEVVVKEQFVRGKGGVTPDLKSASAYRTLPIPLPLLAHLSRVMRERGEGYLFDVTSPTLHRRIEKHLTGLSRVDADGNPRPHNPNIAVLDFYVHPHLLRHTYATRCVSSGMDVKEVQYLLGHSDVKMTLNVYSHYETARRLSSTAEKLNGVFTPRVSAIG